MLRFPGLTPADRADIVCRVFQLTEQILCFCTQSSSKSAGLPHCHTLLWVDSSNQIKEAAQIDDYISAELPDPIQDPILVYYNVADPRKLWEKHWEAMKDDILGKVSQ
ncbi:hypothetical protein Tco_1339103, partial [Tanacetum coccineum]